MIILLTNDDGIEAEGIQTLTRAAADVFPEAEFWTVAPAGPMSQVGHRVTTAESIQLEKRGDQRWAVHGTPADCTRVALHHLLPEKPAWILSGINHGGNMGQDAYISGTVAAVREGAYHGVRGIACSHYMRRGLTVDWHIAQRRISEAIRAVISETLNDGEHWNINLPHLEPDGAEPESRHTHLARGPLPVSFTLSENGLEYQGVYAERPRDPGSDVEACFGGNIAVTRLRI